jgi:hypothetical protein
MFKKITPQNNEWNRKYDFKDEVGTGFVMETKNGITYFAWEFSKELIKFYKCEQGVFEKNFLITGEQVEHEFDPYENISFKRYPMEV